MLICLLLGRNLMPFFMISISLHLQSKINSVYVVNKNVVELGENTNKTKTLGCLLNADEATHPALQLSQIPAAAFHL
jgi:hypothetical protein